MVFFPLDEQLEVWDKHWSEQVAKYAVWLSGLMEFEQAQHVLNRIGHIPISNTSVWRRTERWGQRFQAEETAQRAIAMASPARGVPQPGVTRDRPEMGVGMDAAKVYIRGEEWKDLKVGCVFDIDVRPTVDKLTGETLDLAHAVRNSYVAYLGGPEPFGELVWAEARQRGWSRARDSIAVGDGAPWIWNLVQTHFFDSRQVVDWYHATQHLALVANWLKGEGTPAAHQWLKAHETPLFEGHADRLADTLLQAAQHHPTLAEGLRREAGYFRTNQSRMQYQELREDGYPIGSGMVESGCKRFRTRFVGSGMRWSRPGIERLTPVRAAIMSCHFDQLWQRAYTSPQK